jgi:outer membrane immunogenic protein
VNYCLTAAFDLVGPCYFCGKDLGSIAQRGGMRTGQLIGALIAGLCLAVAATVPACAQPRAPFGWTGFYAGANAGYGWGDSKGTSTFSCPDPGNCAYNDPVSHRSFGVFGSQSLFPSGFTGGIQGGHNWQTGTIVSGFELDFGAFALRQSRSVQRNNFAAEGGDQFGMNLAIQTSWLFTARGRLGWIVTPTTLLYVTGGLALTDLKVSNTFGDNAILILGNTDNALGASSTTRTKAGWTIGGGVEWLLQQNWTFKAEYLYVDFGTVATTAGVLNVGIIGTSPNLFTTTADLQAQIVRLGFNYRFGVPPP